MQLIQVPAQVVDLKPRQDKSWKISFETRELGGDEVGFLADNFQGEGWLVFKANADGIEVEDIPESEAESGVKTPSQRLRAKIFILWKQHGSKPRDFESFYRTTMQKFEEAIESKLEPQ
jgi:hypothetical protein